MEIENGVAETSDPARSTQAIDLRVRNRVTFLHALVVAGRDQFSVARESGADRDAAFPQALLCLRDRHLHQFVLRHWFVRRSLHLASARATPQ